MFLLCFAMPKANLKGIWGWLLFYVVFLLVRLIFAISIFLIYQQMDIILITEFLLVALALLSIFIKYYPKQINIAYLSIAIITTIIAYYDTITSDVIDERAKGVGAVMGSAVVSILWILYWINSKRVKNTFLKNKIKL